MARNHGEAIRGTGASAKPHIFKSTCFTLSALALALLATEAGATSYYWNDANGGSFFESTNWNPRAIPGKADSLFFNLDSTYTVDLASKASALYAEFNRGDVTFDMGGGFLDLTTPIGSALVVGASSGDDAQVNLKGDLKFSGTVQAAGTSLGQDAGSIGSLSVRTNARVDNSGTFYVGKNGTGTLSVGSLGRVTSDSMTVGGEAGSSGEVTVSGTSALLRVGSGSLSVGHYGTGTLTIANSGKVESQSELLMNWANSGSASGLVKVDGGTLRLASVYGGTADQQLTMGDSSQLHILNGGLVETGSAVIDAIGSGLSGASISVKGVGSRWNNAGNISLDGEFYADLTVEDDAQVFTNAMQVGVNGGVGKVLVKGDLFLREDSQTLLDVASLTEIADGKLSVRQFGTANTNGITLRSLSTAELSVLGSSKLFNQSAPITVNAGEVVVDNASLYNFNQSLILSGGNYTQTDGLYSGDDVVVNSGALTLGNSAYMTIGRLVLAKDGVANTVIDSDSTLSLSGSFDIGSATSGTLLGDAQVRILNGARLESHSAFTSYVGNVGAGTVYVGGTGATGALATLSTSGNLNVGADFSSANSGAITVATDGQLLVDGDIGLYKDGTINLHGGLVKANSVFADAGVLDFTAGTLHVTSGFDYQRNGLLGNGLSLGSGRHLVVGGRMNLGAATTLGLDGGSLTVGELVNNGLFNFNSGTFNLTSAPLVVGASGLFGDELELTAGKTLNAQAGATVDAAANLMVNGGRFSGSSITNNGRIMLDGWTSRLGGALSNNGDLRGSGQVDAVVTNNAGGTISVGSGQNMIFTAAGNTNNGRIDVLGGEIQFVERLGNHSATTNIVGRNAVMRFDGGLDNSALLGVSFGASDLFGDIDNTGRMVVSGNGNATFYDNVINNGAVQVAAGSTATFFGDVTGAGTYSGGGDIFYEGSLRPGNSPGLSSYSNDVTFGFNNWLEMELGGLNRGARAPDGYDAIDVAGILNLGGTMDVVFYNGFAAGEGDVFDLIKATDIVGEFSLINYAVLADGLKWELSSFLDTDGLDTLRLSVVSAVPVPAAVWLFGSALLGLVSVGRRKRKRVH